MPVALDAGLTYQVLGIQLQSEIALTSNQVAMTDNRLPTVNIRRGKVTLPAADAAQHIAACCWGNSKAVWLDIPELAKLYITASDIVVDETEQADSCLLQVYLQGYALGVQAMLAGKLVLHATTLSRNDKAIVLCGSSGSGKSTLAAALIAEGFALVSDEISILDQHGMVQPGFDDIKLWQDAVDVLALSATQTQVVRNSIKKMYYRPQAQLLHPVKPAAVYICETDNRKQAELTEVLGFAKFAPLRTQYYRPFLVKPLQLDTHYLQLSGKHLGGLPLIKLARSQQRLSLNGLAELAGLANLDAKRRGV